MDAVHDAHHVRVAGLVDGRDGAHAARVGPRVIVTQSLVVAGCRQRQDGALVAQCDDADLPARQHLLDDDAATGVAEGAVHQTGPDGPLRGDHVATDRDPLARPRARRP